MREPVQVEDKTNFIWFDTEDGVYAFRYEHLRYFRWDNHGKKANEQALHFFFEDANVSVVGTDLRPLLAGIQQEKVAGVRIGDTDTPHPLKVTYVAVRMRTEKGRHEGVDRG